MDKAQLVLAGTIVSLIGCLTVMLDWASIYYEDYYGYLEFNYSGIGLITSGDFTNPDGLLYGKVGILGIITPILVCIAFMAMAARYIVKIERDYFTDVLVSGVLIIIGSIYMMVWVAPGSYYGDYYTEIHEFGPGPIVAILIAIVSSVIAYNIDNMPDPSPSSGYGTTATPTSEGSYAMYCSKCGRGLTEQEIDGSCYCKYCGAPMGSADEDGTEPR